MLYFLVAHLLSTVYFSSSNLSLLTYQELPSQERSLVDEHNPLATGADDSQPLGWQKGS